MLDLILGSLVSVIFFFDSLDRRIRRFRTKLTVLLRNWRRRHRCRDCRFCGEQWLNSLQGQGLYKFWFCEKLLHDLRLVEPDIERRCQDFERKRGSRGALNGEVASGDISQEM